MKITFLGTAGAQQIPVFGCECRICQRARIQPEWQRRSCSLRVDCGGETTLIDAGQADMEHRFRAGEIQRFLLTHYHMDHVQGLFPLRWGCGESIPVFGPADPQGCDDLFKHPGILAFQPPFEPFIPVMLGELCVTPVPLNHSKPTMGYLLESAGHSVAYLTDTAGLPPATMAFLAPRNLDILVLDCSTPPMKTPPRNHNDVTSALAIVEQLQPKRTLLTHLSHEVDEWFLDNSLNKEISTAFDGMIIML